MSASSLSQNRFLIAVGAVAAAAALWIWVNLQGEYSIVKSVPVVFEEMREGKAFRHPIPKVMSVRIRGSGWVVARLFLSRDVKYYINLSSVGESPVTITASEALNHVTLPAGVSIVDVRPETLRVALGEYHEKRVPVSPRIVVAFREGYGQVGPVRVEPESVTVGGTLDYLEGVRSWNTEFRRYVDVRAPIAESVPLEELASWSVTLSDRTVRLAVGVEPFAERTFQGIPVTAAAVPGGREVIFIPPRLDIVVRGGIEQLAGIRADRFAAVVDFSDLLRDTTGIVVPSLNVPDGVRVIDRSPARFQFIIRKKL